MTTPPPSLPFLHLQKDGAVLVDVHVMPNAAKTQIQGLHDGTLRVRLHAPPVDGKANLALQAWLAETLGIPKWRSSCCAAPPPGASSCAWTPTTHPGRRGAAWSPTPETSQAPKARGSTV